MLRKTIAIILTLILTVSILASCGKKESAQVTTDENGKFVFTKQLDLTVWNTQGSDYVPKQIENNLVEDWLIDKTKVKVTTIYGNDGGQWDPKLTKLVAGDNLPNIVLCQSGQGPAHFSKLDKLGKVWELTPEMIQKYAPELWRKTPKYFWDRIKVNGKILGIPFASDPSRETLPDMTDEELATVKRLKTIPNNDVMSLVGGSLYIRDDILKQFFPKAKSYKELVSLLEERGEPIGEEILDIPIYSTEEYIKFMYDIQKKNLKTDGKTVYPYGYSGGDNWEALAWLGADMYGYKGHNYTSTWNDVKSKIEIPLVGNIVKQAAKTQNKMINDRIIDPESLAHTVTQFQEKVMNGQYAICALNLLSDLTTINKQLTDAGKSYRYRPFVTQVPAQQGYGAFKEEKLWGSSLCLLNTLSEKEVYQVLSWINTQYTDEYDQIKNWGPRDAGLYRETADGKREFTDERFKKYFLERDMSALQPEDTKGLQGPFGYQVGGLLGVFPTYTSKWTPEIMYNYQKLTPVSSSGFKFPYTSPHVTSVKINPPAQVWSSTFADIPEVVQFWGARGQWEERFKIAISMPENKFDESWSAAIVELNNIVNVDEISRKMTELAKPIAEQIKAEPK